MLELAVRVSVPPIDAGHAQRRAAVGCNAEQLVLSIA